MCAKPNGKNMSLTLTLSSSSSPSHLLAVTLDGMITGGSKSSSSEKLHCNYTDHKTCMAKSTPRLHAADPIMEHHTKVVYCENSARNLQPRFSNFTCTSRLVGETEMSLKYHQ